MCIRDSGRRGSVVEVSHERDLRVRIGGEQFVDEAARVERLGAAPYDAAKDALGAIACVHGLEVRTHVVAERHGMRRFEVHDQNVHRACPRHVDAHLHDCLLYTSRCV